MTVSGLDRFLLSCRKYSGCRIGLAANQSSVTGNLSYSWDALSSAGLVPVRIFSPEHGLFSEEQDQAGSDDSLVSGIPVISLYGHSEKSLLPDPSLLEDIDVLLFDIQDIGTRYYTYAATLIYLMKTLSGRDTELVVLDRPNPLGGCAVEGPMLQEGFGSFVGVSPVPVRHGLTLGETALFAASEFHYDVNLRVEKITGWTRDMFFPDTGMRFIPPSPNMPCFEASLVYPGMCLLEGTNLSEGRGTTRPFEIFGAPFIKPEKLLKHPEIKKISGAVLRPFYFRPVFNKYAGQLCGGFFIHVTDPLIFKSFRTGISIIRAVMDECPEFAFLRGVYEFNSVHPAFDLLCGNSTVRELLEKGADADAAEASWKAEETSACGKMKAFHIY